MKTARETVAAGLSFPRGILERMDGGLSMASKVDITRKHARGYVRAAKKDKGVILGQVCAVTGWSRDNARRRLTALGTAPTRGRGTVSRMDRRKRRDRKYSPEAVKALARVWAYSGGQCGKYLLVSMTILLDGLERHGELADGKGGYCPGVRVELEAMSAATIEEVPGRWPCR